ncbi:hypothetical protein AN477_00100, partial [Alicyclobacillus ferrooxydans]
KSLIRAVIKKIEVEPNRKDIKKITFWFDYDDALLLSKTGGTVPQVVLPAQVAIRHIRSKPPTTSVSQVTCTAAFCGNPRMIPDSSVGNYANLEAGP